ncbi:hypothetical protein N7447_004521 [Penicillium robsamsonii]|uniref:uncharacterized protein n=1 Tax=Penicillium robsamsonii TaxID=1792511 RepID=UPI0025492F87|nr:uncharacterized protein N7447_004521 [Penicillium robsamsonii]KAJ5827758.1 hypothetical protein N7447_004521 [Penicillium robsamsonii]
MYSKSLGFDPIPMTLANLESITFALDCRATDLDLAAFTWELKRYIPGSDSGSGFGFRVSSSARRWNGVGYQYHQHVLCKYHEIEDGNGPHDAGHWAPSNTPSLHRASSRDLQNPQRKWTLSASANMYR